MSVEIGRAVIPPHRPALAQRHFGAPDGRISGSLRHFVAAALRGSARPPDCHQLAGSTKPVSTARPGIGRINVSCRSKVRRLTGCSAVSGDLRPRNIAFGQTDQHHTALKALVRDRYCV